MFKSGFSSQSEGMGLWDVEGLAELEDVVGLVDDSEGAGALPSASSFLLTSWLEANVRWLRGCTEDSLDFHLTLANNRLRLR